MIDDSQNLALAFWRRSKDFLEAANLVAEAAGERVSIPAYYLWAHSIELSLKVFLISQGVSLRELKSRQLGHNLMALWQRGVSLGLEKKSGPLSGRTAVISCFVNVRCSKRHRLSA